MIRSALCCRRRRFLAGQRKDEILDDAGIPASRQSAMTSPDHLQHLGRGVDAVGSRLPVGAQLDVELQRIAALVLAPTAAFRAGSRWPRGSPLMVPRSDGSAATSTP